MSYVYFWLRSDGTPYYVGKGTGRRGFKQEGHRVWSFESVAKVKDAARNKPRIGGRFVKAG
jgi:hypothetical protein